MGAPVSAWTIARSGACSIQRSMMPNDGQICNDRRVRPPGIVLISLGSLAAWNSRRPHLYRHDVIGFAMQDEKRRVNIADMADRVVTILQQQPTGSHG